MYTTPIMVIAYNIPIMRAVVDSLFSLLESLMREANTVHAVIKKHIDTIAILFHWSPLAIHGTQTIATWQANESAAIVH